MHERTVGKLLRRLRMTRLQPLPHHPKRDLTAQEALKNFAALISSALPLAAAGKTLEVWFRHEARVGQKGTLSYIWAPIGSRPAKVRDCRHESAYLFGRSDRPAPQARPSSCPGSPARP